MDQNRLNREQQEVLALLKEIDAICRKNQITYFLSPRLTLCATEGKPFPSNPLSGNVLMKVEEMERFRKAAQAELPEDRALESMKNNPRFPGFFLRYEDKNTLCYRLYEGRNYQYPGFGINILPLRVKNASKKVRAWDQRLETGWVQTCDNDRFELDFYRFACGWMVRMMSIASRKMLGKKIYDRLCETQSAENVKQYRLRWNRNGAYTYPSSVFETAKEAALEGESFLIPCDEEKYLKVTFGKNYKNRSFRDEPSPLTTMISTRVSCEEFLREAGPLKKLVRARRRQFLTDNYINRSRDYFNWCWEYAKICAARRELSAVYIRKKDYIRNLWEDRDLVRLEEVFRPYKKMMKQCMDVEEVFEPDEEILDIYMRYLQETGALKTLEKIRNYR